MFWGPGGFVGKLHANFSGSFDGEFRDFFGLVFPVFKPPPPPPPKKKEIHAQNRRHSSPISLSRTHIFVTPIFWLRGRPKKQLAFRMACHAMHKLSIKYFRELSGLGPRGFTRNSFYVRAFALFFKRFQHCRFGGEKSPGSKLAKFPKLFCLMSLFLFLGPLLVENEHGPAKKSKNAENTPRLPES